MVYVTNPGRRAEVVEEQRKIFGGAEGVQAVYGPEDSSKLGLPLPAQSDQAPDLMLAATPEYMFGNELEGDYISQVTAGGTHGYLYTDPQLQAIFIATGVGIPKGIQLGDISNLDVAPTIARLLGIEMKRTKGHAIEFVGKRGSDR